MEYSEITQAIGWSLIHFVWQGAAIALGLVLFVHLAKKSKPQWRYGAGVIAMLLMVACAITTFYAEIEQAAAPVTADTPTNIVLDVQPVPTGTNPPASLTNPIPNQQSAASFSQENADWLPWIVALWLTGVGVCLLRFIVGWLGVQRARKIATPLAAGHPLSARLSQLSAGLKITLPVRLLTSATAKVPMVIGAFKPAVIIPASLMSGLDSRHLEAIIAHELAHIRRHDYLINLLQNLVEALFFYHPAVWFVSAQMRKEREHCCDDVAAKITGGALDYGRALTALEELLGADAPAFSVAANSSSLLSRIRRLAGVSEPRQHIAWPAALLSAGAAALVAMALVANATGEEAAAIAPNESPQVLHAEKLPPLLRSELAWGESGDTGLAAAIDLNPYQKAYQLGAKIRYDCLIANFGDAETEFKINRKLNGGELTIKAIDHNDSPTTFELDQIDDEVSSSIADVKLAPGEFIRVPSAMLFLRIFSKPTSKELLPAGLHFTFCEYFKVITPASTTTTIINGDTETEIRVDTPIEEIGKVRDYGRFSPKTLLLSASIPLTGHKDLVTGIAKFKSISRTAPQPGPPMFALTFEGGPHSVNTPALLDILKERHVNATFFLLGSNVKRYPDIVRRIVAEGHEIGNHTMKHQNFNKLSNSEMIEVLRTTHDAIVEACGVRPKTFRAPYGVTNKEQEALIRKEFGYNVIRWSIDPADWQSPYPGVVAKRLIERAHPGAITLLHDIHAQTVSAIPAAIDGLIAKGYQFSTVSDLPVAKQSPE